MYEIRIMTKATSQSTQTELPEVKILPFSAEILQSVFTKNMCLTNTH